MHTASLQSSVGRYQETTDDKVMLSTTWYCNGGCGLMSPGNDTNSARAALRKWMDIPLPSAHPNKGKGGGKGKQKGSRPHHNVPPHEFKDSPCTVPTNFYYDVYKKMGAVEQYSTREKYCPFGAIMCWNIPRSARMLCSVRQLHGSCTHKVGDHEPHVK